MQGHPIQFFHHISLSPRLLEYYLSSLLTRSVARSALQARIPRDYLSSLLTRSVARSALQARIPRDASSVGRTDDEPGPGASGMEEKISPFRPHSFALHDRFISVYLTGYTPTGLMVGDRKQKQTRMEQVGTDWNT